MKAVYVNESACIACGLCEVYCKVEHSKSKNLVKAFKRESPPPLPRLRVEGRAAVSFAVPCRHCREPFCVYACLTGALQQDASTGVVRVDAEKCIGCWTCLLACPFGAIRQDAPRNYIVKCDLCPERNIPVCVANCPNEALVVIESDGEGK